jgi:AraC-like DNA-binding protein
MTKAKVRQAGDPRYTTAFINPLALRHLAVIVGERGHDAARLCRGLGFEMEDFDRPSFRISYRQGSLMIRRALETAGDMGLGIAVGQRQTIVSWGLVGFAMMSCATVGEAIALGLGHQRDAGALATLTAERRGDDTAIVADPVFDDPDIEMYLVEEMFSSFVAVMHQLVGPQYSPAALELVYQAPAHAPLYAAVFRCPIRFGAPRNRFLIDPNWMRFPLPTHDALVARTVQDLIERSLLQERSKTDLATTVERAVRESLTGRLPTLREIAVLQNISERTLRRRLADAGCSYDGIVESVRKSRALELLKHSSQSIGEVAREAGFSDVRTFRRAFKRWTGVPPNEAR